MSILDARGCTAVTGYIAIVQPQAVSGTYTATGARCYGTATASLTLSGTNGSSPYMYRLGSTGAFSSSNIFNNIKGTTYKVYAQDAKGCTGIISAIVPQPSAIIISYTKIDISCKAPGSITVIKSGGPSNPPYLYKLNTTAYMANSTISVANTGNYYGYIKDLLGCLARTSVIVMPTPSGCSSSPSAKPFNNTKGANKQSFTSSLSPNPTPNQFTLTLHSSNTVPVSIRVMDAVGKKVYAATGNTGEPFIFGERFSNGLYLIEVKQGDEVKIIKAVKSK